MTKREIVLLLLFGVVLFFLWLPGIQYPILSDTAYYALLGEQLWTSGEYILLGEPYAKHLPFHAFLSYPFVRIFGYSIGMKVTSLLAGYATLVVSYVLLRTVFGRTVALLSTILLSFHHAFVLMTQLGSADLTFTALFLGAVTSYYVAYQHSRYYVAAFVLAGLATLTRYNGAPLFVLFFVHSFFFRKNAIRTSRWWMSAVLGGSLFGMWLLRNAFTFGDPFHTEYTGELAEKTVGVFGQIVRNALYYFNPIHNLLPILFIFLCIGLWRHARQRGFLLCVMLTAYVLTSFWWVQAMRFAFPAYPILMGFAVLGLIDSVTWLQRRFVHWRLVTAFLIVVPLSVVQTSALCVYAYGECNAAFDQSLGAAFSLPENFGLTPEGFYSWNIARTWVQDTLASGSILYVPDVAVAHIWQEEEVFGSSVELRSNRSCDMFRLTQHPDEDEVLFSTHVAPVTYVTFDAC